MGQVHIAQRFYARVWPHRSDVLRVAQFLCRDHATAEDLTQETLLKAFRALDRVDATGKDLKPWLFTILRNTWTDRLRATHGGASIEALTKEPEVEPTRSEKCVEFWKDPQVLIEAFSDQQIIDALKTLPEEIRWTLLLVDVEGMEQADAAEVLSIPVGTVKSRAHRGRAMLRTTLQRSRQPARQAV